MLFEVKIPFHVFHYLHTLKSVKLIRSGANEFKFVSEFSRSLLLTWDGVIKYLVQP